MKILESSENYLETILVLHEKNGSVRAVDIANHLSYSKASVSVAMKNLRENGYIQVDEGGNITLLESGRQIAEKIYRRHQLLNALFIKLGVPSEIAAQDACRIEHVLSEETFQALQNHFNENSDSSGSDSNNI